MSYLKVCGYRAIVKVPEPKHKKLGEKGIECIVIWHGLHRKSYKFYVIEQNEVWSIHAIVDSRDAIFDEKIYIHQFLNQRILFLIPMFKKLTKPNVD